MDTDFLYPALSKKNFYDCIRPVLKQERNSLRGSDCTDEFSVKSTTKFLPRTRCTKHKKHDRREPGLFKEQFPCAETICLLAKHNAFLTNKQTNSNLPAKI